MILKNVHELRYFYLLTKLMYLENLIYLDISLHESLSKSSESKMKVSWKFWEMEIFIEMHALCQNHKIPKNFWCNKMSFYEGIFKGHISQTSLSIATNFKCFFKRFFQLCILNLCVKFHKQLLVQFRASKFIVNKKIPLSNFS